MVDYIELLKPLIGGTNRENQCGFGYVSWKLDRVQVYPMRIGKSLTFTVLFESVCRLVAKRSVGQQFSELDHHKEFALIEKMTRWIWNKALIIYQDLGPQSGQVYCVLRTCMYYLTCPGQVFILPLKPIPVHVFQIQFCALDDTIA